MKRAVALLVVALLILYGATLCRTVGTRDSGLLTVAMTGWGVPFWPGFPLLTLIGNLVSLLPHPGEPALPLNLMNALFSALACGVLAAAVAVWTGRTWAGAVAGAVLGTSRVFWSDALALEVFSFNALMAALLILLLAVFLRRLESKSPALWPLPLMALVMSTCVTHQPTLGVIAVPALIVVLLAIPAMRRAGIASATIGRTAGISLLVGLAGLLPLLYVPLAARHDPAINWTNARLLADLPALILRTEYATSWLMSPSQVVRLILQHGESASPLGLAHLRLFLADLPRSFGWLAPALAVAGLVVLARRGRQLLTLVLLALALMVVFFMRVNTPLLPLWIGVTERFYILPHLLIALLAGCGAAWIIERAERLHPRGATLAGVIAVAAIAVPSLWSQGAVVSQRGDTFTRDFGANFLSGVPPRALAFVQGDLISQGLLYQQRCLGARRDVSVVDQPLMGSRWYIDQLRRREVLALPAGMSIASGDSAAGSRAWIDLNLGARPIIAVQFADESWAAKYRMIPMGLWSRVVPRDQAVDLRAWSDTFAAAVRGWRLESIDRDYEETSWEAHDQPFYTYALGTLRALLDVADRLEPGSAAPATVPALTMAERWSGPRRAAYLAYQASFWANGILAAQIPTRYGADSVGSPGTELEFAL